MTEEQLEAWGRRIGARIAVPVFIGLKGPLGAGKSVLARAVARGAGVEGPLPSPTFNLLFEYSLPEGRTVVHADLYRIESPEELAFVGWDEALRSPAVMLVEWPCRAESEIPADRWEIELGISDDAGIRSVGVERFGDPPALPSFLGPTE